jgi:transaldolase
MSTTEVRNVNPNLRSLAEAGTSPWLDLLGRSLVESGELARLIAESSLRGETSNPSIFEKSILESDDYDDQLKELFAEGLDAQAIYEALAIRDVQEACDVMRPLWDECGHQDGFVSLEVAADLAHDTEKSINGARDFWKRVKRPNVMIKIPGTPEGVPAIEQAIYEGINVNVTLLFSVEAYERVADAYLKGLERRLNEDRPLDVASVASFFVSRIDSHVDAQLAPRRLPTRATPTAAFSGSSPGRAGSRCITRAPTSSARCGPRPASRTMPIGTRCTSRTSSVPIASTRCRRRP